MSTQPQFFSPYDVPMWESVAANAMKLQACTRCGAFRYPPGPACPECLSTDFTWKEVAGNGRVLSWATFHRQYLPAYPAPHTVIAVQLDEGPIMVGYVKPDAVAKLKADAPARIVYCTHPDGYRIPTFEPI